MESKSCPNLMSRRSCLHATPLQLQAENDASVEAVLSVIESDGWEHVTTKSNINVVRKFMPPPASKVWLAQVECAVRTTDSIRGC